MMRMDKATAVKQLLAEGILPTAETINALVNGVTVAKASREKIETNVEVVKNFEYTPKKMKVDDFTEYFKYRYNTMKNLLFNRPQVANAISISQAKSSPNQGKITIIAMISYLSRMNDGALRLNLEDLSGSMNGFVSAKDLPNIEAIEMLTLDEVVGLVGTASKNTFYIQEVIWPDIPEKPAVRADDEVYAVFSGDIHVGSNNFLEKDFKNFIRWLKGEVGSEKQKEVARRTKYFFIPGDLVDGIGIYPGQQNELTIDDIYKQYDTLASMLSELPDDKKVIICPGNHDAVRLEEPQPRLYNDYAATLGELPNVTMVTNPSYVKIHNVGQRSGFDVLMYHGYGFDMFIDRIEGLRLAGGYDRADLIHEFLLKRRHLAPTHDYNLTIPMRPDPLIITHVPDIMVSGHIHKAKIGSYKNTLSFSGSCWQAITDFQKKVGHNPDPGHVPLLNLQTRKSTMLQFK